jgi:hypothetical protein
VSGRQTFATLLAVVAAVSAVLGASAWWLRDGVIARQAFVDRAVTTLDRDAVRRAIVDEIAAQAGAQVPAGVLPAATIRRVAERAVRTQRFRRAFRTAAGDVADALFQTGPGSGSATLTVDLAGVLGAVSPQLASVVAASGADSSVELVTVRRDSLPIDTPRAADLARTLAVVLPALACFALAGAVALAVDRRRLLGSAAVSALVCGALLLAALFAGHAAVQSAATAGGGVSRAQARAAAGAVFDVYTGGLRTIAISALVVGLVAGVAALLLRGRRVATP